MTLTDSDRRARGLAHRQARAAQVRGIRRRVVASSLGLFVATWMLITLMLVTGHDPALGRTKRTALTTARASTPVTTTTTAAQTTTTTSSSGTSSLTTSQS